MQHSACNRECLQILEKIVESDEWSSALLKALYES